MLNLINKDYAFELDLKRTSYIPRMEFVVEDKQANILNITLTENGAPLDLTGYDVQLNIKKADGHRVTQDNQSIGGITITNAATGQISIVLLMQSIAAPGENFADISIVSETEKMTTSEFKFYVRANKDDASVIDSTDYITQFEQLEADFQFAEDLRESTFQTNESDRQGTFNTNETLRINTFETNETFRVSEFQEILDQWADIVAADVTAEVVTARDGLANLNSRLARMVEGDDARGSKLYDGDLNNLLKSGFYYTSGGANRPVVQDGYLIHVQHASSDAYAGQYYLEFNKGSLWVRSKNNGVWNSWSKIWTDFNQLIKGTSTIPTSGWVANVGDYSLKLNLAIVGILATDWIDVSIDKDYQDIAADAEINPTVDEYVGGITIYANKAPSVAIPIRYKVVK